MDEKKQITITEEEFDKAVADVMGEEMESEKVQGMAKIVIPMVGAIFASKVKGKLFDTEVVKE